MASSAIDDVSDSMYGSLLLSQNNTKNTGKNEQQQHDKVPATSCCNKETVTENRQTSLKCHQLEQFYAKNNVGSVEQFVSDLQQRHQQRHQQRQQQQYNRIISTFETNDDYEETKSSYHLLPPPPREYDQQHRFIRINFRFPREETLSMLREEINLWNNGKTLGSTSLENVARNNACIGISNDNNKETKIDRVSQSVYPIAVPWLEEDLFGFYAIPGEFPLRQSTCFQNGRVYGQDICSGAAVAALVTDRYDRQVQSNAVVSISSVSHDTTTNTNSQKSQLKLPLRNDKRYRQKVRVLDLCCSPGLKLCAIADYLSMNRMKHSNILNKYDDHDVVVGVDISEQRMAACKRIVHKYQIAIPNEEHQKRTSVQHSDESVTVSNQDLHNNQDNCKQNNVQIQLYCNDARTFGLDPNNLRLVFTSNVAYEEEISRTNKNLCNPTSGLQGGKRSIRKRMNKSARAREKKRLKALSLQETTSTTTTINTTSTSTSTTEEVTASLSATDTTKLCIEQFDLVLVDAECSTDGSIKHLRKRLLASSHLEQQQQKQQQSEEEYAPYCYNQEIISIPQLTDPIELANLVQLQKQLIASGFRLLKEGGDMIYSTCSLCEDQNEGIVRWLLQENPKNARIVPVAFQSFSSSSNNNNNDKSYIQEGTLDGTVRFIPTFFVSSDTLLSSVSSSCTHPTSESFVGGGFFLAKIHKLKTSL